MALKASDVFVVQQATGAQALAKVSAYELSEWVETTGGVHYIGTADFTSAAAEPQNPNIGDLWINSASSIGTFAWTYDPNEAAPAVSPNDKAVWNNSYWDVLPADSGTSVVEIQAALPITVANLPDPTRPIVGINQATTTTDGSVTLASAADLTAGNSSVVVTADQLASVIADLDQLEQDVSLLGPGTVTAVLSAVPGDPITVTNSTTTPTIAIKDGGVLNKGVVMLASDTDIANRTAGKVVQASQLDTAFDVIDGGIYASSSLVGNWSSQCSGNVLGDYTYDKAFDGITDTESNRCSPASGETVSFIPQNELNGDVSVWATMSTDSLPANSLTVNGTDYSALATAQYPGNVDTAVLIQIPESSINTTQGITWTNSGFIGGIVSIAGIEVGGSLLIDE